jgi:5-methylcytosine-specific restriction protein A
MAKKQYAGPWRRIRKQILDRDQYLCQIRGKNCTTTATQVDHITPVHTGGAWYDPNNLRAACATCNNQRTANRKPEGWQTGKTIVTLVGGPPKGGKLAYIQKNSKPTHIIIDYDTIAQSLGLQPNTNHDAINAARNALLRTLRQGKLDAPYAWITTTNPKGHLYLPHHHLVIIKPDWPELAQRYKTDGTPAHLIELARQWYEPSEPQPNNTSRSW